MCIRDRFEKGGSIWNIGFCGIPQKKGEAYKFCLFAKTAQETKLEVSVIENNVCFASTTLLLKGNGYVKYDAVLAATGAVSYTHLDVYKRQVQSSMIQ